MSVNTLSSDPVRAAVAATGSPAERFTSDDPADFAVPTGREELWRFTPLRPLRSFFQPFELDHTLQTSVVAPANVTVERSDTRGLLGSVLRPADRIAALVAASTDADVLVVSIPARLELSEPVIVTVTAEAGRNYQRVFIDAAAESVSTVVLDFGGSACLASSVEISLGQAAQCTVVSVQQWHDDAVQVATHVAGLDRDSHLRHISVTIGGALVRLSPSVQFRGPGARAELFGLSFADVGEHFESRLYVDHGIDHCSSNVVYKSVLQGESARTVWIGDVRIRPEAIGTETYELNRNLLLSSGARADSVPNLEIETGEIAGAGHASATGRFDDTQLFYLQSRGIPEAEARRLVVRGFLAEVLDTITIPELRTRLTEVLDARLAVTAS